MIPTARANVESLDEIFTHPKERNALSAKGDIVYTKSNGVRPLVAEPVSDRTVTEGPVLVEPTSREPRAWIAARLAVAIPLLTLSAGAMFPFAIIPVSSQAVVNARLSDVRAPAEGTLRGLRLETGDTVTANEPMVELVARNTTAAIEVQERQRTEEDLKARSLELEGQIAANQRKASRFNSAAQSYRGHLASDLQVQVRTVSAEHDRLKSRVNSLTEEVKRDQQAVAEHLMPRTMLDQAQEKLDEATRSAQDSTDKLSRLQRQVEDVQSGYLLDPNSQAPVSIEQQQQAESTVDQLREEKRAIDEQLASLRNGGSVSASAMPQATVLRSPVTGPVWARSASPWQSVEAGDDLFRVADESSIHVEVWLDRRYGPELSIGDVALVYLSGMGTELTGKIVSFQGTSRRRLDEEVNAIDLQPVHPDQYHVTIELRPEDRKSMYIGQAAKVLFPGSKSQVRARLYSLLMRF